MTSWRGFTTESKHFCGYWSKTRAEKVRWWFSYFFVAGPLFWFYIARDELLIAYYKFKRRAAPESKDE